MSFLEVFKSKQLYKHLAFIILSLILVLIITFLGLNIYTRHGSSFEVPDFNGLTEDQFKDLITEKDLRYRIIDSAHVDGFLPGTVVEQTPSAGSHVKKNRTIFLTINALSVEKVHVPNIIDFSLRNAKVTLESYGLEVGELIYIPSEFTNLVLGQHYKGKPIAPGTSIPKGTSIDLIVGKGLSNQRTNVPDLIELSLEKASNKCIALSLNIGAIIYDESVITQKDTLAAFIWKQSPESTHNSKLRLGSSIDIWLTADSAYLYPDSIAARQLTIE